MLNINTIIHDTHSSDETKQQKAIAGGVARMGMTASLKRLQLIQAKHDFRKS
jgi:hypothetical protein